MTNSSNFEARKFRLVLTYRKWLKRNQDFIWNLYKEYCSMEGNAISFKDYAYEMYSMFQYAMIPSPDSVGIEITVVSKPNFKHPICHS